MRQTELLDAYDQTKENIASGVSGDSSESFIGIRNASFTWSSDPAEIVTPGSSRRNFSLRIEGEVTFKQGKINLIVGPTGCGKTSLLMALLGELHYVPTGPDSRLNLPRENGVAYAAQESWVQNETIRDNILFGSEIDETRYRKVIHQCGLSADLALFEAGDKTEVGEKGLTLSGGQKARVTLARAVYSRAQVLILDDILAALDVHAAKWIVEKCLKGDLVRGRTVLLVVRASIPSGRCSADATVDPQRYFGGTRCGLCRFPRTRWQGPESRTTLGSSQVQQGTSRGGQR